MKNLPVNPRVRIHKNGTATLSGIDYGDLRSILTAAHLHRYKNPSLSSSETAWHERQHAIIQASSVALSEAIADSYNDRPPAVKEIGTMTANKDWRRSLKKHMQENSKATGVRNA